MVLADGLVTKWSLRACIVLLVGAVALAAGVLSQQSAAPVAAQSALDPPSVSVVGEGIVVAQPDLARVRVGVEVVDPSLSTAQQQAATQMDQVINTLLGLGVERRHIQTVQYSVQPEYDGRAGRSVLTGYRVVNVVSARLPDLSRVGEILDAVVAAGAGRVEGISFGVADEAALKNQAREQAVAHAQAKAAQLANLTGVTLGRPLRIQESDRGGVVPVAAPAAREALQASTPVEPGEMEIRTQVQIVYAIQ